MIRAETQPKTLEQVLADVDELLTAWDPAAPPERFLAARYDSGLAWLHHAPGAGGRGLPRAWQSAVEHRCDDAGAPHNRAGRFGIGLGMAAPTLVAHGSADQLARFLRPMWTGEEVWCQLFSEPGAGSDLAGVATRAVRDGDGWRVTGQKVWTSIAHEARWGLLLARTDPDVTKHAGLTYFICDMHAPGVEVRPLRQLTGEAEFNEVFLDDVFVPDQHRVGAVGEGWRVAGTTLSSERVALGGKPVPQESGMIGPVAQAWRERPEVRTPVLRDRLVSRWVEAEAARLLAEDMRRRAIAGTPGPEGSALKLVFARNAQALSALEVEMLGSDGLRYGEWSMTRPDTVDMTGRDAGYRYLRARGNSIEGGTSEVMRTIIAERVLGLPAEHRVDTDVAWKDLPR